MRSPFLAVCVVPFLLIGSSAVAKRAAPQPVAPLVARNVRYTAEHQGDDRTDSGVVVATDVASGRELWRVTVYTRTVDPKLERDVQEVHIARLLIEGSVLLVEDEQGKRFAIDLRDHTLMKD